MACTSCSSGGGCSTTSVGGCGSKGGCSSGGCNRLNVFDWLQDVDLPSDFKGFDIVEIRFKGGRKDFYRNASYLPLTTGDAVVIEAAGNGWHLGHVSLKGELVRLQMKKKKVPTDSKEIRNILRIASSDDVERWEAVRDLETGTMFRARSVVEELRLKMKLSDVEYQADRTRATFFYSADDRVDFRDLIKRLADEFRVRVEMRQISLRHEAGRLGGIGSCGRELCCSTWLTDFKSVSTTAARYQNLSLNPAKLSGQCGRLKCCLNYELDTYLDALKDIPQVQRPLQTERGDAFLQKTDIFKKRMWFAFRGDNNWVMLPTERVREVQEMNKRGEKPENLLPPVREEDKAPDLSAIVEGSLDRLDDKIAASKRGKRKRKGGAGETENVARAARPPRSATSERPERSERSERPERPERTERPERPERTRSGDRPPRPAVPAADAPTPAAGEAAGASEESRRPRGAAAKPLNRRNNRGRGEKGDRPERPQNAEGRPTPESGAPREERPPRANNDRRPPRAPSPEGGEASARPRDRNDRNRRRGDRPGRTGGDTSTPPTPPAPPAAS
ncbi:Signal peptidase-like protein [Hymenobacter sp. BT507]|uniref:Signal peptidase-like protein n=1 Tax=Hymenobacter citatus TaxID=2763506 RepID=A0ABR7MHL5_9BACT|nr:Signal peptidase-like protein [Hymenobacter citatus]